MRKAMPFALRLASIGNGRGTGRTGDLGGHAGPRPPFLATARLKARILRLWQSRPLWVPRVGCGHRRSIRLRTTRRQPVLALGTGCPPKDFLKMGDLPRRPTRGTLLPILAFKRAVDFSGVIFLSSRPSPPFSL